MARPVILKILGDSSGGVRAVKEQRLALKELSSTTTEVSVATQKAVNIQIAAATKRDARLREEIVLYHEAAAAAVTGSKEQIAATNLAIRAEERLAKSLAVSAVESQKLAVAHGRSNRELSKGFRGALAGSGAFRALGRSIAFASGGFLVFATVSNELRKSFDAARQAAVTQRLLVHQFDLSGLALRDYKQRIEEATRAVSRLAGFEDDELIRVFVTAFRQTQNVGNALRIQADAADAARATGKDLALVGLALTKAYGGQTTALRRLGILVPDHTKGLQVLEAVERKYAGAAAVSTTAQQKFHAALFETEEVVGKALLPQINNVTLKLADWLGKTKNQRMVQRELAQDVKLVADAVKGMAEAFKIARDVFKPFIDLVGGLRHAATLLVLAFTAVKIKAAAAEAGITRAGIAAQLAAIKTGTLAGRLKSLPTKIGIAVIVGVEFKGVARKFFTDVLGVNLSGITTRGGVDPFMTRSRRQALTFARRLRKAGNSDEAIRRAMIAAGTFSQQDIDEALGQTTRTGEDVRLRATSREPRVVPGPPGFRAKFADLELKRAQAELTKRKSDDRAILTAEAALLRERINYLGTSRKTLKERTDLTQQLVGVQQQITQIDTDGAKKETDLRKKRLQAEEKRIKEELAANKKLENALQARIKTITSAFKTAVDATLQRFGAIGQGPILAPSESAVKGILGAGPPGGSTIAADIRAQTKQALLTQKNVNKILAQVPGTKGTTQRAKGQRALKAQIAADLYGMSPEDVASIAATPGGVHAFVAAEAARRKAAVAIARVEMKAQLVTLHATRIRLANVRGRIEAETQVINHIKIEIDGRTIKPRKTTTTTTTRSGRKAGVKPG